VEGEAGAGPGDREPEAAPALRASDAERERTVARLRVAGGEGRLTLDELAQRVEAAYGARTDAQLAELVADLPAAPGTAAPPADERRHEWLVSIIGGADRRGRWRVAPRITSVELIGGADLDFTEGAILESPDVEITAWTLIGGPDIRVPDGVEVELSGFALIGGHDVKRDAGPTHPGAPRIRVRAYTLLGGADIKGPRKPRRRRRPPEPDPPAPPGS
jgi:hypothetical protein